MADMDKALATQLANMEKRAGKSLDELAELVRNSGLDKHGQKVAYLKETLGMGHGDANLLVHWAKGAVSRSVSDAPDRSDVLDGLYVDKKAALRPIHDALMKHIDAMGTFEEAPKKTYVSYRRDRQFAMIGPATNTQVEVGLNVKDLSPTDRLQELGPGKMCNYRVRLSGPDEVDDELVDWIRAAYEAAG